MLVSRRGNLLSNWSRLSMVITSHHSSIVINNIIFIIAAWSWWSNDATNTIFPKTRTWSNRRAGHGGDLGDRPASGRGRDISGDEVDAEIVIWIDWALGCTEKDMERETDMEMYEDRDMHMAQRSVLQIYRYILPLPCCSDATQISTLLTAFVWK